MLSLHWFEHVYVIAPGMKTKCLIVPLAQKRFQEIKGILVAEPLSPHSDPLVTKLDFDKEPTPGPKRYPTPDDIREPQVHHRVPDKEEVQVLYYLRNYKH